MVKKNTHIFIIGMVKKITHIYIWNWKQNIERRNFEMTDKMSFEEDDAIHQRYKSKTKKL